MSESALRALTRDERQQAIVAVATALRSLPVGVGGDEVIDVTEAALRQVLPLHIVIQASPCEAMQAHLVGRVLGFSLQPMTLQS